MTSRERRRQYNKIWARVSRAQKAANKETHSSVEMVRVAESDSHSHNQHFEEEILGIFPDPALSSSESEQDPTPKLREELSEWACTFQVKHNAVDALLNILKRHGHAELPHTARTLFGNKNQYEHTTKDGVESV